MAGVRGRSGIQASFFTFLACTFANMSIEQLANVDVSSVSKRPQALADAPASIFVIDHDRIVRSGAVTIPEMLRLAPNLQVYQTS